MKLLQILVIAIITITATPSVTMAQSNRALEQLSDLNRINPLQNPKFDRADKVLKRKIIDRKNKVVGRVQDIVIHKNGTIASIKTDFDRLHLGNDLYLNYRTMNISTRSNGYTLGMDADELEDFYPQLLANIETAAGDGGDTFSVEKLMGAILYAQDGRKIGKVKNILFGNNGGIARAVYAELTYGIRRGKTIAIPLRNANFSTKSGRTRGTIDNDFANAMLKVAGN